MPGLVRHPLRLCWRAARMNLFFLEMIWAFVRQMAGRRRRLILRERSEWLQRYSGRLLKILCVQVNLDGHPPEAGLVVCNHLSYLDILVLASVCPAVFVSKADVKGWPIFGWFSRRAGTLYVQRERRSDVGRITAQMRRVLDEGHVLVFFPEGTSSGGETVLPFRSALLEPVARQKVPVTPAALSYALDDGDPAAEVCYWRDMTLFPHLLNLLTKRSITANVVFGQTSIHDADRKALAQVLHAEVLALKNGREIHDEDHRYVRTQL